MDQRQRQEPIAVIEAQPASQNDIAFSSEEEKEYNNAYALLSPQQMQSARLESAGIVDRGLLSARIGVTPQTITAWRDQEAYKKIIKLCTDVVDRVGRQFRANCVRHIIAPAYAELINRMADPEETKNMATKDLVDMITKMTKEIRQDTIVATDESKNDNDIIELQNRRRVIMAEQSVAIADIRNNGNIIQFPKEKAMSNG